MDGDGMPSRADMLEHGILDVASPVSWRAVLRRPDPRVKIVQFGEPLTERDHRRLAGWLTDHPSITLRAWGHVPDLEFLRHYPHLRRFSADTFHEPPVSFDGRRHLRPDLQSLSLGATSERLSLGPLQHFTGLRRLHLEKHTKDIDVLSGLTSLRGLSLRQVTLADLSLLLPLAELRTLELKLGATRDLALLPHVGRLEYLELWMVRGLDDLTAIADVPTLRYLHLESLRQVSALPPDLSRLSRLDTVVIETMKGLTDLTPLLTAPALRRVALVAMSHLQPEHVGVLAPHPTLGQVIAGLGSDRKNRAVEQVLPQTRDAPWDVEPRRALLDE